MSQSIEERILHFIRLRAELPMEEKIDKNQTLHDIGLDSLDSVELIFDIEHEYNLMIDDEIFENLNTPNKLISYIIGHQLS